MYPDRDNIEIIRCYTESDWSQVREIYDLSKPDEIGDLVDSASIIPLAQDEQMYRYFIESSIWVYEMEQNISGFIGLKGNVISWLFVHPDYRRQGIARKLLIKLIEEHNVSLKLNLVKNNSAAMSLYLNLGFKVFEEFEGNMYGQKIPAVRMKLNKSTEPALKRDGA